MTLKDYIDEEFPINDLVRQYNSDPITRIMQADSCLLYTSPSPRDTR